MVWLQDTSKVIGLLIVCFSEPLLIVSYALRFIRIHRIFDAQERYFKTGVRPSAMIKRYSDPVLAMSALTLVSVLATVYTVLAVVVWDFGANGYGYLPTYALSTEVIDNQHNFISLMYLVCSTLVVGLIFAYLLDKSRQIRKEFAMLSTELQLVTAVWLTLTDAVLLFVIQGSFLGWFNDITYYRVAFWLLTIRSIAISFIAAWRPIREARSQQEDLEVFFPIPPNRECIESVDMVLHIPIAVEFFYLYLHSRHLEDRRAIHFIALYIDLRLYDKACSEVSDDWEADREARERIARDIYFQFLSPQALDSSTMEQDLKSESKESKFFPVNLDDHVKMLFDHKWQDLDSNLNEYLFIEVYAFVLDKLREYF